MTEAVKCRPREAENVVGLVRPGTLVTVKEPWLVYSIQCKGGRRLDIWRPVLDRHSPRPGEPAVITAIVKGGGRLERDQFRIESLDGRREDWFRRDEFEVLDPAAAKEAIAQFKERGEDKE